VYIRADIAKGQGAEKCIDLISQIYESIKQYHQIPKTDPHHFEERIARLDAISSLTNNYIELRGGDIQHKRGKKINHVMQNPLTLFQPQAPVYKSLHASLDSLQTSRSHRRTASDIDTRKSSLIKDGKPRPSTDSLLDYESVGLGPM